MRKSAPKKSVFRVRRENKIEYLTFLFYLLVHIVVVHVLTKFQIIPTLRFQDISVFCEIGLAARFQTESCRELCNILNDSPC